MMDGKNILLRPYTEEYSGVLCDWYNSGEYPFFFRNFSVPLTKDGFANANYLLGGTVFAVLSRETKECLGFVGVVDHRPVPRTAKLMAIISKRHQRTGVLLESFLMLHRWCFKKLDCREIMIDVAATDERSNRLCAIAGYTMIGPVELCVVDGDVQDEIRWKMSKQQYLERYH